MNEAHQWVALNYGTNSLYSVTFNQSGLPTGTNWFVHLTNHTLDQTFGSTTSNLTLYRPNGTFGYAVAPLLLSAGNWYGTSPSRGTLAIHGTNISVNISYVKLRTTSTQFRETGLPSGSTWGVTLGYPGYGISNSSTGSSLNLSGPISAVPFSAQPPGGYGLARIAGPGNPSQSWLNVTGKSVFTLLFAQLESFTFNPNGLPSVLSWAISIKSAIGRGGPPSQGSAAIGSPISFTVVSGVWTFHVTQKPTGYLAKPARGSVLVSGVVERNITFLRTFAAPGFGVDLSPDVVRVSQTGAASLIVSVTSKNGFSCSSACVTLSVTGLPANATYQFSQPAVEPGQQSTLEILAYASLTSIPNQGTFSFNVTGQDGYLTDKQSAKLIVQVVAGVQNKITFTAPIDITSSTTACPTTVFADCSTIQQNFFILVPGTSPQFYWAQNVIGYGDGCTQLSLHCPIPGLHYAFSDFNVWSMNLATGAMTRLGDGLTIPQPVGSQPTFVLTSYFDLGLGRIVFTDDWHGLPMLASPSYYTIGLLVNPAIYVGPARNAVGGNQVTPPELVIGGPPNGGATYFGGSTSGTVTAGLKVGYPGLLGPGTMSGADFVAPVNITSPTPEGSFPEETAETSFNLLWQVSVGFPVPTMSFKQSTVSGADLQGICFY
jgi:hypothetical protein